MRKSELFVKEGGVVRPSFSHHELLGIGPRLLGEALYGDEPAPVEPAPVDHVRRLLAALGDDQVGAEALRRRAELGEAVLLECRDAIWLSPVPIGFSDDPKRDQQRARAYSREKSEAGESAFAYRDPASRAARVLARRVGGWRSSTGSNPWRRLEP